MIQINFIFLEIIPSLFCLWRSEEMPLKEQNKVEQEEEEKEQTVKQSHTK